MGRAKALLAERDEAESTIVSFYVEAGGAEECPNHSYLIDQLDGEAKEAAIAQYSDATGASSQHAEELFNDAMMNHVYDDCPGCVSNAAS